MHLEQTLYDGTGRIGAEPDTAHRVLVDHVAGRHIDVDGIAEPAGHLHLGGAGLGVDTELSHLVAHVHLAPGVQAALDRARTGLGKMHAIHLETVHSYPSPSARRLEAGPFPALEGFIQL